MTKLANKCITPHGLTRATHADLEQAKERLKQAKLTYFHHLVVFTELKEILLDVERGKASPQSVKIGINPELYSVLEKCVAIASSAYHTSLPPTEHAQSRQASVLGIKPDHLRQVDPRRGALQQHLESVQQSIIPELEARLKEKCEKLVEYHSLPSSLSSHSGKSRGLTFAKAAQLPLVIEEELKQLKEQEEVMLLQKRRTEEKFWEYYQSLCESLDASVELVQEHRLRRKPERDRLTCDWLAARCDAMCLKLAVIKGQLLKDTYSHQAVVALRKIKHQLDEAIHRCKTEHQHLQHTLQTYRSLGSEFESLVSEYSQLQEAIKNKRWALKELSQAGDGTPMWQMRDTSRK